MSDSNVIPFRKRPPSEMELEAYERMTRNWHPDILTIAQIPMIQSAIAVSSVTETGKPLSPWMEPAPPHARAYYGDAFKIERPTGSSNSLTLC